MLPMAPKPPAPPPLREMMKRMSRLSSASISSGNSTHENRNVNVLFSTISPLNSTRLSSSVEMRDVRSTLGSRPV